MKKVEKDLVTHDAFLKEIADEVKSEQLKNLWNKYGLFIVIFVALVLTAAVSFETFLSWRDKKAQELSNAYAVAVSLQNQGRTDESLNILKELADEDAGLYSDIARLQIANIYIEQKKIGDAMNVLEKLANDSSTNEQMRDIATLKLASYKLDTNAPADEIKSLLNPLTKEEKDNGYNIARELLAMLAIREGNLEQAKAEYEKIATSNNAQDNMRARAQDMIAIIEQQNNN